MKNLYIVLAAFYSMLLSTVSHSSSYASVAKQSAHSCYGDLSTSDGHCSYVKLPILTAEELKDFTALANIAPTPIQNTENFDLTDQEKKDLFKRYCLRQPPIHQVTAQSNSISAQKSSQDVSTHVTVSGKQTSTALDTVSDHMVSYSSSKKMQQDFPEQPSKRSKKQVVFDAASGPIISCKLCGVAHPLCEVKRHFKICHQGQRIDLKTLKQLTAWTTTLAIPVEHFKKVSSLYICLVCTDKSKQSPRTMGRTVFVEHYNRLHRHNNDREVMNDYNQWLQSSGYPSMNLT